MWILSKIIETKSYVMSYRSKIICYDLKGDYEESFCNSLIFNY